MSPVTRHTADLAADTYRQAQKMARDEYGLSLAEITRGLYALYLADPKLREKAAHAALRANADLKRAKAAE